MNRVKKKWLVELTRYNFGQPFSVVGKTFDSNPTRHEVQQYLDEVNSKDPDKDFRTTIEVIEYYEVENLESLLLKNLEVVELDSDYLIFNNGMKLHSKHEEDCCESHYLSLEDLTIEDFEGLRFDLTTDNFFERVEDYGIALLPTNGHPVRIPGYGYNNGYYSDNLSLVVTKPNSEEIYKSFDVTECQKWVDDSSY